MTVYDVAVSVVFGSFALVMAIYGLKLAFG